MDPTGKLTNSKAVTLLILSQWSWFRRERFLSFRPRSTDSTISQLTDPTATRLTKPSGKHCLDGRNSVSDNDPINLDSLISRTLKSVNPIFAENEPSPWSLIVWYGRTTTTEITWRHFTCSSHWMHFNSTQLLLGSSKWSGLGHHLFDYSVPLF